MPNEWRALVFHRSGQREIALLRGSELMEYMRETSADTSWVGRVLLGTIQQVLPNMGAAFVDIGQRQNGFLPLREADSFTDCGHDPTLVTGRDIIVQVKKDAVGGKGAFLTRDVTLPGKYVLFMPQNRYVGISGRIKEDEERAKAMSLGQTLVGGEAGVIVRHAALNANQENVRTEWDALRAAWHNLLEQVCFRKPPAVLYGDTSTLQALCRDCQGRYAMKVVTNEEESLKGCTLAEDRRQVVSGVELDALWQAAAIARQLEEALARKVSLSGGGTLVVDEREALVTIDVNSGRFLGNAEQEMALAQNLAACPEIARQVRLRNLSGIVMIDFIDMGQEEDRRQVRDALAEALAEDRAKTAIHGFTQLGLLEMTRKRTRESLLQTLTEPCDHCGQTGRKPARFKNPPLSLGKGL